MSENIKSIMFVPMSEETKRFVEEIKSKSISLDEDICDIPNPFSIKRKLNIHTYKPYSGIKEDECLKIFATCEKLQDPNSDFGVHYLSIMKEMHIGFKRLQNILTSISHNWVYFKIFYGYTYRGWTVNVDKHKCIMVDGHPILHLRVKNHKKV